METSGGPSDAGGSASSAARLGRRFMFPNLAMSGYVAPYDRRDCRDKAGLH